MTREELLLQLKDISPPLEPAWWLPGPGHLAIVLALLAACVLLGFLLLRRRADRLLIQARRELQLIETGHARDPDASRLARELARWLRQVSLLAFPGRRLQGVTGDAWLEFLDQSFDGTEFTRGAGRIFGSGIYRQQPPADADALLALCNRWLSGVAPRLRRRAG